MTEDGQITSNDLPDPHATGTPMPQYVSHKEVWALKIEAVVPTSGHAGEHTTLHFEEKGFLPRAFTPSELRNRPVPQAGMYMIQYADGYISFSPADAFEKGYTRV